MQLSFEDFWKYYIGEIEKQVPKDLWNSFLEVQEETKKTHNKKPEKWTPAERHAYMIKNQLTDLIHNSLKKLTDQQVGELNYYIRSIVKFPKKIALVYTPKLNTYASWYNASKKQFEILYPTITIFMKKFPESLKAGIMHELGHIINGDSLVKKNILHSQCANIAMDARINMHLDYKMLDYLTRCLVFENETGYFVKPEDYYPSIGLPVTPGGYSWDFAHEQYHFFDDPKLKKPNLPKPGQGKQELTQEEAEEILGTLSPDQIKEMMENAEEQEGDGDGQEQEGEGGEKEGKDKKGKGNGQNGEPQEGEEGEGGGNGEEEGEEKGKSGQGKPGSGEPGEGEPGGGEGEQGEEKPGQGKPGSGKQGDGKEGDEKGKKPGEGGEKPGDKGGEEGKGKSKTSGGDDPTKNSRQNKGLTKNIDKTIAMLNKIKEKYTDQ